MVLPLRKTLQLNKPGFTLAEIVVAMGVLGVISTFNVTKVLTAQQATRNTALAKEAASTITGAYQEYNRNNRQSTNTTLVNIMTYVNSAKLDTTSTVQRIEPWGATANKACTSPTVCYQLNNGAIIFGTDDHHFSVNDSLHSITFSFDPDAGGPEIGVTFYLYYNGRFTSQKTMANNTVICWYGPTCATYTPIATGDPSWFRWN
jgi:prepilin-type N-terminal cleavage/methylation domain-containing protein